MFGLTVLVVAVLYLSLLIGVTSFAYGRAVRSGLSRGRAWKHAGVGFMVVYLPVFWNHLPNWLFHTSMCYSTAGIQIYVDPEKWIDQRQNLIEELRITSLRERLQSQQLPEDWMRRKINRSIVEESRSTIIGIPGVSSEKRERRLIDTENGAVVAVETTYARTRDVSDSADLRSWLYFPECTFIDPKYPRYASWSFITNKLMLGVE